MYTRERISFCVPRYRSLLYHFEYHNERFSPLSLKRTIYTEHTAEYACETVPDGRYSVGRIICMTDYMHLVRYLCRLYFTLFSVFIFHLYMVSDFSNDHDDLLRLILTLLIMQIMFHEPYFNLIVI